MDLTHIFLTLLVNFVAHVEVGSTMKLNRQPSTLSMQSYFRRKTCPGGNLLKIHTHQCTNNGLCEAKLDGSSTQHNKTRFRIKDVGTGNNKKKCIEFRNKYALKVVNSTHVAFEKLKQGCRSNIGIEFQFEEIIVSKQNRVYKYKIGNNIKCLGFVSCNDATLSLIDIHDRRCYFENLGTATG